MWPVTAQSQSCSHRVSGHSRSPGGGRHGPFALAPLVPEVRSPYADVKLVDVNRDRRDDLVASSGHIYLRREDGTFPAQPRLLLPVPEANDWTFLAVGDFNADTRPDVALLSYGMRQSRAALYYHTNDPGTPFDPAVRTMLDLDGATPPRDRRPLLRDTPPVADWDGDGVDDLIVGRGQDNHVRVLRGGRDGLAMTRVARDTTRLPPALRDRPPRRRHQRRWPAGPGGPRRYEDGRGSRGTFRRLHLDPDPRGRRTLTERTQ